LSSQEIRAALAGGPQYQDRGEEKGQDAERRQLAGSLGQNKQGSLDAPAHPQHRDMAK